MNLLVRRHGLVFAMMATLLLFAVLASDTATLTVEMETQEKNFLQVFWAAYGGNYSEEHSVKVETKPGRNSYRVRLDDALNIHRIRVDFQQGTAKEVPAAAQLIAMSYSFKWLFDGQTFDREIKEQVSVNGVEIKDGTSDSLGELYFTEPDPKVEFVPSMNPRYMHLFYAFMAMAAVHCLCHYVLMLGRKNRFMMRIVSRKSEIINELSYRKLKSAHGLKVTGLKLCKVTEEEAVLAFACPSVDELHRFISVVKKDLDPLNIRVVEKGAL